MADILSILQEVTEEQDIDKSTSLEQLGNWNSLAVIGFLAKVDKECGVRINPALLAKCSTVGEVLDAVDSQIHTSG